MKKIICAIMALIGSSVPMFARGPGMSAPGNRSGIGGSYDQPWYIDVLDTVLTSFFGEGAFGGWILITLMLCYVCMQQLEIRRQEIMEGRDR